MCRPVLRSGLSEPKQGLHLWVLHLRSFLSIYRLHWCKHGTTVKGSPEFHKFTLTALYAMHEIRWFVVPYCEVGFLHQKKVYIFGFSTSVASFPYIDCIGVNKVPRWKVAPSFANLHWRHHTRCMKSGSLQARTAKWAFCTKTRFAFLGSPPP